MTPNELQVKVLDLLNTIPKGKVFSFGFNFRQWFEFSEIGLKFYVRKSQRYIENEICPVIDLASIEVEPDFQRKGYFNAVLAAFEQFTAQEKFVLYVESVLSEIVRNRLEKLGYIRMIHVNSYYKDFRNVSETKTVARTV